MMECCPGFLLVDGFCSFPEVAAKGSKLVLSLQSLVEDEKETLDVDPGKEAIQETRSGKGLVSGNLQVFECVPNQ